MELPVPSPGPDQVLIRVRACAVCRTDLHVVDGELPNPKLPLIPGHQIVGTLEPGGQRVGVPWLGWTCGTCRFCTRGQENLCDAAKFTGYTIDGGYAESVVADERYVFPIPPSYSDEEAAPLLCAGLVGYRALRMCGDAARIGFYGFGSAAHILAQVARQQGRRIFAFTRPGDATGQQFARDQGCDWVGSSDDAPPEPLDAAILFAPVGALVPKALQAIEKGGSVVCAGIHMSQIPAFPYELLWGERQLRSVANLTRSDGEEFFHLVSRFKVKPAIETWPLEKAGEALDAVRLGRVPGTAVLKLND